MKQTPLPFFPAILRIKNAALRIRPVRMSQPRDKHFFWVARIDKNPRNLPRILQPNVRPCLPAVRGPVHPIPVGNVRAHVRLARPHVNDLRIRRRHGNGPNRSNRLRIKYRFPGAPSIIAAPNASVHGAKIKNLRLSSYAGNRQRSPAPERPTRPPPQFLKQSPINFLSGVGRRHHRPSGQYARAQKNHTAKIVHSTISDRCVHPKNREYISVALLRFTRDSEPERNSGINNGLTNFPIAVARMISRRVSLLLFAIFSAFFASNAMAHTNLFPVPSF